MADWNDAPSGEWNDSETPTAAWADEPTTEEPENHFNQQSAYETPEAPVEPITDDFGRSTGTVKSWRADKAFGFIGREDGGPDVFVHIKGIKNGKVLKVGDVVSYLFETGGKGPNAKEVVVETAAEETEIVQNAREFGIVKGWRGDKGFGFIGRDDGGSDVFCHSKDVQEVSSPMVGSRVSFRYIETPKGGGAKEVRVEETGPATEEGPRESGSVKSWNTEKGFGFIGWSGDMDAFAHKRDVASGNDLAIGQAVSFIIEDGPKGASAKKIEEEEGGELVLEDESDRLYGKVKNYDEDKGFCFIGRCDGQGDVFGHKRNFQGDVEPAKGMGVSFVLDSCDRGDSAMKIREEEEIPEMVLSDEGREFGIVTKWMEEKGFGYIQRKKGGEEAHVHSRACEGFTPKKGLCVSFVFEENDKGPTAKDVREEDPERVARITAVRRHGVVSFYADPASEEFTNGYGFIIPDGLQPHGAPRKYYFHMDSITTPDEYGGLWPHDHVSFIVVPAKKGVQAIDVTLEDPTKPEKEKEEEGLDGKIGRMGIGEDENESGAIVGGKENAAPVADSSAEDAGEWDLSAWGS